MLKKFSVMNFKNFKNTLELNLGKVGGYKFNQDCIRENLIGKSIIYGRNATGKTNLGEAICDIVEMLSGRRNFGMTRILNADSKESVALFRYEFEFDDNDVVYEYQKNQNGEMKKEALFLNGTSIFRLDTTDSFFGDLNLPLVGAETIQLERYMELIRHEYLDDEAEENVKVPFLRFILNNAPLMPDSVLRKLEEYVSRMGLYSVTQQVIRGARFWKPVSFIDYLKEDTHLQEFQQFLNDMGMQCELYLETLPDGQNALYFKHEKLVPFFETASSGTISLVNFYRRFVISLRKPSFIYMDEFDAFYHYEMAENLVKYFKQFYPECQIVMTTHNTNLMTNHLMRPDCLFILSREGKLTALCDATERELREGHNLEKLYIGGEFEKYE